MGLKYAARAGGRGRARWAERAKPAHGRILRGWGHCACRGVIGGSAPLPPGRLATLAAVRLPYIVGEVAALRCGRRGAEGLRFFGKIRKPPTPLRRLLRRRHPPLHGRGGLGLATTQRRERKRSQPRSAMGRAIRHRDDRPRTSAHSHKRQHPPPTSRQSAFLWRLPRPFLLAQDQRNALGTRTAGAFAPASRTPPQRICIQARLGRHNLHFCG